MNKKIIFIVIGVILGTMILGGGAFFLINKGKEKSVNQNAVGSASNYIEYIRVGKYDKAYELLDKEVKAWLTLKEFSSFMDAYMDEKGVMFNVDESRKEKLEAEKLKQKQGYIKIAEAAKNKEGYNKAKAYAERSFTYIPVNRIVTKVVGGKDTHVTETFDLTIVHKEGKPYIYTNPEEFYMNKVNVVFTKAFDYVIDSMEYSNDKGRVEANLSEIEKYIKVGAVVPSDFRFKSVATLELNILNAYYKLIQGDYNKALEYMLIAENVSTNPKQLIRVKEIKSEIYMAQGMYAEAVKVLEEALDTAPDNEDIKKDYRRITAMMIDEIEGKLTSGWAQLNSAISQEKEDRIRILKDIAMIDADKAIQMNVNAPDGYFLKGSINYALGNSSAAVSDLEKALSLAESDDTPFRTEVAQILGLAKTTNVNNEEQKALESYKKVVNTQIRSIFIREAKVGGLVDKIK